MSHKMKIWVVEGRLRKVLKICGRQDLYGSMGRKSTTDPVFVLRTLIGKSMEGHRELLCLCTFSDRVREGL